VIYPGVGGVGADEAVDGVRVVERELEALLLLTCRPRARARVNFRKRNGPCKPPLSARAGLSVALERTDARCAGGTGGLRPPARGPQTAPALPRGVPCR